MREDFPSTPYGLPPDEFSDKDIEKLEYRTGLFKRRGLSQECADAWAARLLVRDYDRDDRHICIECSNLQRGLTCAVKVPKTRPDSWQQYLQPLPLILQRCPAFKEQRP